MTEQEPTRIIEQLPDGRIRYHTYDGRWVTGWQHGLVAVREEPVGPPHSEGWTCSVCGAAASSCPWVVDFLFEHPRYTYLTLQESRETAAFMADHWHHEGEPRYVEWACAVRCSGLRVPFHHWLREQRDAG